ncbi:hypothetical protein [Desulfoluna spongiiphila]|uniref:hypothetical protein n=1 Tax=Desulfoluna spongiiphila TaxID=419481 RepID=UPI001253B384|nr:hypothetical protein [Desulfoluna spongiiphila]VVS94566.1 hypothetical protein DBB_41380 [Desulfoluna spongiiphila]
MTINEETIVMTPLWLAIEENLLALEGQSITEEDKEKTVRKMVGDLDGKGYAVSKSGIKMMALRWALDDMLKVGRPMLKDLNKALSALTLEDLANPCHASYRVTDDLGKTWERIQKTDRREALIWMFEDAKLDLLIEKAQGMGGDLGIRLLIDENVESPVILERMGIPQEKLDQVNADIAAEIAARNNVLSLLETVEDKPDHEKVKFLFSNDIPEDLIIEVAQIDQADIDKAKKAMEEELKEQQRLADEAAAKRKAEAEGPALEDIPMEQVAEHIYAIREIQYFSEVEKEIRAMCEQSAIPKALVDLSFSDPDKFDELEKQCEG